MKNILLIVVLFYCLNGCLSLFQLVNKRASLKSEILSLAEKTERGLIENSEENAKMRKLFEVYHHDYHYHNHCEHHHYVIVINIITIYLVRIVRIITIIIIIIIITITIIAIIIIIIIIEIRKRESYKEFIKFSPCQ